MPQTQTELTGWTIAAEALLGRDPTTIVTDWRALACEMGLRLWARQSDAMDAVAGGAREVAIKSGHGVGKTFLAAFVVAYWLRSGGPGTIVITSAPTNRQVEHLLWREFRRLWPRSETNRRLGAPRRKHLEIARNWAAYGFSTNEPDRFQGWHAPRLRVLIDEANGFPEQLFETIDACLTGSDSQLVLVGNPIAPVGRFWRAFADDRVARLTISAREHPNVTTGRVIVPGAVTREWIEEFERRYGHDEDTVRSRIDGEFPQQVGRGLVSLDALRECCDVEPKTIQPVVMAVDVARYGDASTVATRLEGQRLAWQRCWSKRSLTETAREIERIMRAEPADYVVIDDTGIGGGVTDVLRDAGFEIVAFRGGEAAIDSARYFNRTSEAWGVLRDLIEERVLALHPATCRFDQLCQQLCTRRLKTTSTGKMRIEPKDEYAQRTGLASPDEADSLAMAAWQMAQAWARQYA